MSKQKMAEPKYSRTEILGAASSFGVRLEVLAGALRMAGKNAMTRAEVEEAIKQFKGRKV